MSAGNPHRLQENIDKSYLKAQAKIQRKTNCHIALHPFSRFLL